MVSATTALALVTSLSPVVLGALDKPVINPPFPNGLSSLNQGLLNNYGKTPSNQNAVDQIPQWCKDAANAANLPPNNFKVFSVKYNDCNDPWIMCHHASSPVGQDKLVEIFGRIPVRMRSYIRHIAAFKGANSAYNQGNNIALFGTTPNSISVMIHEVGHSIDNEAYDSSPFHDTTAWKTAYNNDKAVADTYAQTNQAENHSQELVVAMFDKRVPGGIKGKNSGWKQIQNQFEVIQSKLGNKIVPGGGCGARLANDAATTIASAPAVRGRVPVPVAGDEFKITGETFEPKTPANAPFTIDTFDDEGSFLGIKQ